MHQLLLVDNISMKENIMKHSWRWKPTPVVTFSLVSLLVTVIIAGVMAVYIQQELEQLALRQAAEGAAEQVDLFLDPNLESADFAGPLAPARYQEIAALMEKVLNDQHIVRVKIWNRDGLLIYSDEKELVGRYFPLDGDLQLALDGQTTMDVSSLNKAENYLEKGRFGSQLLEIYVPLRIHDSPQISGSYEIYHDLAVVGPRIAATRNFVWVSIALGFSLLYGLLVILVYGVSRQLARSDSENARLYEETKEQLAELKIAEEALQKSEKLLEQRVEERTTILADAFEFSQEIVSQPDFNNLVDSVTMRAKNLMHAKSANVCLLTQDRKQLELTSRNVDSIASDGRGRLLRNQMPIGIMAGKDTATELDAICASHQMQISDCCLSALLINGDSIIGSICVARDKSMPFTDIENHTLKLLANSAAVAIANIRLMENSRSQAELNATLTERQRLTSELHDEAAQTLSLLNLKVGELDFLLSDKEKEMTSLELEQFKQLVERAQAQMRMAFSGMSTPAAHKNNDIFKELTDYVREFSSTSGISVDLVIGDLSSLVLPALIHKQAMYIYREALTNVKRYANVTKVQVHLEYVNEMLHLVVSDEGRGFDPNLSKSDHHLGLAVMQARTERVGGTLSIETAPGSGTRVTATIPILTGTPVLNEVK
jgi:signal transduction histidine kinase